jgi:hypothetical protein
MIPQKPQWKADLEMEGLFLFDDETRFLGMEILFPAA